MKHIEVNGCRLNVQIDVCQQNAPWIMFSNSLITDLSIWDAQINALKSKFNILRYDQRGHGESTLSDGEVDFEVLSEDVIHLLDELKIARVTYIGLSMGVPTGLAAYSKDRFDKMILIDGQAKSAINAAEGWQERIDFATTHGMDKFANVTAERWLVSSTQKSTLEKMMSSTPLEGFIAAAKALKSYDYQHVLQSISCPVLLMAGSQDGKMPITMQAMAEQIKNASFIEIEQAGHVPCFEQADSVNKHIIHFMEANA